MRVFISSVRKGLEEERDALAGLILAVGHEAVRFEDFTAQPVPSREACVEGVRSSDVYVLLLGPHYGEPLPDTGQSPTEDEWVAAKAKGMPRLAFRKEGIALDPDQVAFVSRIGEYTGGAFYDTFSSATDLLVKVAAKLRELESGSGPLEFGPLDVAPAIEWRDAFDTETRGGFAARAVLELHVLPWGGDPLPRRVIAGFADSVPRRLRASTAVEVTDALAVETRGGGVVVRLSSESLRGGWNDVKAARLLGVRVGPSGQVSAWGSLLGDMLGSVLDPGGARDQVAGMLRLIGEIGPTMGDRLVIAVGIAGTTSVQLGSIAQLPRTSAGISMSGGRDLRIEPDETVSVAALSTGASEVAGVLVRALVDRLPAR